MDKRKKREQVLFNLIALAVLILFLFPIYWMVITSLKSSREIFAEVPTFFLRRLNLRDIFPSCLSEEAYLSGSALGTVLL